MELAAQILSDVVIFSKYSRYLVELNRRETWSEIVDRTKQMHLKRYPQLKNEIETAFALVYEKKVLPSMRVLQFAGRAIELNPARLFNCSFAPVDDVDSFCEIMFLLLSGCGTGYSVQKQHINKLPEIRKPTKTKRFVIQDSIVGWADAVKALTRAYFTGKPRPDFDFGDIRPKGAPLKISGGIAPGPEPLKTCLHNIQKVFDRKENGDRLTPLEAHDIICHIADCVLAGGVRRAATISLFNLNDEPMLSCKFGNWYELNPQRARANNSAVLSRQRIAKEDFFALWEKMRFSNSGEPGFFFSNDHGAYGINPCAEASLKAYSFCNLSEINFTTVVDQQDLNERARIAAFIGTLQAGYTNFHYLRDCWKQATEKDALLGVSLTGLATKKLYELNLTEAAEIVKTENARVAKLIGINTAARCTLVKPSGTASLVLGTSSGIHAWHSKYYIRRMRINKEEPLYKYLVKKVPALIEDDYFKPTTDAVLSVPYQAPKDAITRDETALDLLQRITYVYQNWILPGHRRGSNTHNTSATVTVKADEWDTVRDWMWTHKNEYTALSILPEDLGSYKQPPFETITKKQFDELSQFLCQIDLKEVKEFEDTTTRANEPACSGSTSCELTTA